VILALLLACVVDPVEEEQVDLSGTFGTVEGSVTFDGQTLAFASGVAYGSSFFHGGNAVVVLTTWASSQCGGDGPADWEGTGDGYKLDLAFDDGDGDPSDADSALWRCSDAQGFSDCEAVAFPLVDLGWRALDLERGAVLDGGAQVEDTSLAGDLDFQVTYCGEE
jgi:hypothetical protein